MRFGAFLLLLTWQRLSQGLPASGSNSANSANNAPNVNSADRVYLRGNADLNSSISFNHFMRGCGIASGARSHSRSHALKASAMSTKKGEEALITTHTGERDFLLCSGRHPSTISLCPYFYF